MRYWRPFTRDAAAAAESWGATEAILLPLYPQFSSTTTASSLKAWRAVSALPARSVCCYPGAEAFAQAHADSVLGAWRAAGSPPAPRVIFSAHGLPQRVVDAGDPYQWQVEQTVAAVRARLPGDWSFRTAYQSRVGPLRWLEPATLATIDEAVRDGVGVIVSPVAFVSEHIETLVELDIEYAAHAREAAIPFYLRAPALGTAQGYIQTLADLAEAALADAPGLRSGAGARICPAQFALCPHGARS
jgi:ferrochelatase